MHMGILAMGYEFLRTPCAFIGIEARAGAKPDKAKAPGFTPRALKVVAGEGLATACSAKSL